MDNLNFPSELQKSIILEIVKFLKQEFRSEYIAVFEDKWGWNFVTNDFNGLLNPEYESVFRGIKQSFPEVRISFSFMGEIGFNILRSDCLFHNKKVFTVKQE